MDSNTHVSPPSRYGHSAELIEIHYPYSTSTKKEKPLIQQYDYLDLDLEHWALVEHIIKIFGHLIFKIENGLKLKMYPIHNQVEGNSNFFFQT